MELIITNISALKKLPWKVYVVLTKFYSKACKLHFMKMDQVRRTCYLGKNVSGTFEAIWSV